jgi:hypothetical protein
MVILTASVGKKCAVLLPKEFMNEHSTPSTGLVINRTLSRDAIILVEEVWQFQGLLDAPLSEKVDISGSLRYNSWGWVEVPRLTEKTIVIRVKPELVKEAKTQILDGMIKQSVSEFKKINRI